MAFGRPEDERRKRKFSRSVSEKQMHFVYINVCFVAYGREYYFSILGDGDTVFHRNIKWMEEFLCVRERKYYWRGMHTPFERI